MFSFGSRSTPRDRLGPHQLAAYAQLHPSLQVAQELVGGAEPMKPLLQTHVMSPYVVGSSGPGSEQRTHHFPLTDTAGILDKVRQREGRASSLQGSWLYNYHWVTFDLRTLNQNVGCWP